MTDKSVRPSRRRGGTTRALATCAAAVITLHAAPASGAEPVDEWQPVGSTQLISRSAQGRPGNIDSYAPALSADGRYVTFASFAENLVPGAVSGLQVYLHDRETGTTIRVSESPTGDPSDGQSREPSISADGRYVAYESGARNLVPPPQPNGGAAYLYDRVTDTTILVSRAADGGPANGDVEDVELSADGNFLVYRSSAPDISARASAPNISARPSAPGRSDVYLYDVATGATTLVSHDEGGARLDVTTHTPTISADGALIAYSAKATNLVPGVTHGLNVYLYDVATDSTSLVSLSPDGQPAGKSRSVVVSADGSAVAFTSKKPFVAADTNGRSDAYRQDVASGETVLVSFDPDGAVRRGRSTQLTMNGDASVLAYTARGDSATQRYLGGTIHTYDMSTGQTRVVSQLVDGVPPPGRNRVPALDADGGYVAYISTLDVADPDQQYPASQVLAHRAF